MSGGPDAEREPSPYIRLPWPAVAAGLLGFVVLVLMAGLFANRNLRPQVGMVPTPSPVALATATSIPVVAPAAAQGNAPNSPSTPMVLIQVASPTPTVGPASLASTATPAPAASATPSELPTVEPVLADEVGKAYVTFWRVRSDAALNLDSSRLQEVMDGDYLQNFETRLGDLKLQRRAIKTQVTLNYRVVQATTDTALVHDQIEDDSFYVETGTEKPLTDPVNGELLIEFKMAKLDGVWKVIDSVTDD